MGNGRRRGPRRRFLLYPKDHQQPAEQHLGHGAEVDVHGVREKFQIRQLERLGRDKLHAAFLGGDVRIGH